MGPDLELKGRSETIMEVSTGKNNGNVVKELEDKQMRCASNYEDTLEMETVLGEQYEEVRSEQLEEVHKSEDVEVNIMDSTDSVDNVLDQPDSQDATESSSSFENTSCEAENGEDGGDTEVVSQLHGDAASMLEFGASGDVFRMRKKRLTSHWRTFIQPLLWRCKWVELQIKKFQSQAVKYDKLLAENNKKKQLKQENIALEGHGAKSMPFSNLSGGEKIMKRKKRKRTEDLMDTAEYMAHHNLFSYYANRRFADGAAIDNEWANLGPSASKKTNGNDVFGVTDELLSLDFRDDDNSLEQILWKIGVAQSQVSQMKSRLNNVMSENAERFSSIDKLSMLVPCNAFASSAQKFVSPPNNDRVPIGSSSIASQFMPENHMDDPVMPESATSSHGEVTPLPDITESRDPPQISASRKTSVDGILIYNRRAKKEPTDFEDVKIHPMEKLQVPKEEEQGSPIPPVVVPEDMKTVDQPPKLRSISKLTAPKNKRKRARRKASSGKWSRKSSG